MEQKKINITDLIEKKKTKRKITMLTAYDYQMAKLIDKVGIDVVLVGDSVGNVVLGYDSTVPVTVEEMLHHTKAVRKGVKKALLVADMPFMSYNISIEEAIYNAGRFMKEAGAQAVKLEGAVASVAKAIVEAGIPVVGHIGLTPQTVSKLGGYKVQGKDLVTAQELLDTALGLQAAGCFLLILECVPGALARFISENLDIPTVGIGAGPDCDGQVLVSYDLLGIIKEFKPKFVKRYADLSLDMTNAFSGFKEEVEKNVFPATEHTFSVDDSLIKKLKVKK